MLFRSGRDPSQATPLASAGSSLAAGDAKAAELRGLLRAMGYEAEEIQGALQAVAAQGLDPEADLERWLGDCLRWLSRSAA